MKPGILDLIRWTILRPDGHLAARRGLVDNVLTLPLGVKLPHFQSLRVSVFLHAFHIEDMDDILTALGHIPPGFRLFVSTDTREKLERLEGQIGRALPHAPLTIRVFPNCGRDIAPKFVGFRAEHRDADLVLHLHTKKSPHDRNMRKWRGMLFDCLVGSPEIVESIVGLFQSCPDLGMLAPRNYWAIRHGMEWGDNFETCRRLAKKMGIDIDASMPLDFAAGSMFWARPAALGPIFSLNLAMADFEEERGQVDGTMAHAVERMTFLSSEKAGLQWIHAGPEPHNPLFERAVSVSGDDNIPRIICGMRKSLWKE